MKNKNEFIFVSRTNLKPRSACKECENRLSREKEKENPAARKASRKKYVQANRKKVWEQQKAHRVKNPEQHRARQRKWRRNRYKKDPMFRVVATLRKRLWEEVVKKRTGKKDGNMKELLGAPWAWVEAYLEEQFVPGMTWKNYGPIWHIDHIRPCASFDLTDPEQQKICFHWTNLQPLFAVDNLKKGDTYDNV